MGAFLIENGSGHQLDILKSAAKKFDQNLAHREDLFGELESRNRFFLILGLGPPPPLKSNQYTTMLLIQICLKICLTFEIFSIENCIHTKSMDLSPLKIMTI